MPRISVSREFASPGARPPTTAWRQILAFPGNDLASRWVAGMMLFQTGVWAFIVVDTTGGGGDDIGTPYHVCFFLAFTFVCGLVAVIANLIMRDRSPASRGPIVWGLWALLLLAWLATLPAQGALIERNKWPSVGLVTASVGMSFSDVQNASTVKLRNRSDSIQPKLRYNQVASLRLASTPTTFARCWVLELKTGSDERVAEIDATIVHAEAPKADVDRVLAAARVQLASDGWKSTDTPDVYTQAGMRLSLTAHRTNPTDDDDVTPEFVALVDVTSASLPAATIAPSVPVLPPSFSPSTFSHGTPYHHLHHFGHHHR